MTQHDEDIDNKISNGMITIEANALDSSNSSIEGKAQMFKDEVTKYKQICDDNTLEGRQSNIITTLLRRLAKENTDL